MSVTSRTDVLLDRMKQMSAADISVLEAGNSSPAGARLTTMPGSPNDALWTAMEREGWMTATTTDIAAGGVQLQLKVFKIEDIGQAPIAELLNRLRPSALRADGQSVLQRVAPHLDAISNEVTPRLINTVKEAGGNGSHIVIALSHIVARVVRRTFKPEDQGRVLRDIATQTERFLETMSP